MSASYFLVETVAFRADQCYFISSPREPSNNSLDCMLIGINPALFLIHYVDYLTIMSVILRDEQGKLTCKPFIPISNPRPSYLINFLYSKYTLVSKHYQNSI